MQELIKFVAARVAELQERYSARQAKLMALATMDGKQEEPVISSAGWHAPVAGWVHWETGEVYDKGQFIPRPRDDWYCGDEGKLYPVKKHRMLVPQDEQESFREAMRNYADVGFGKVWMTAGDNPQLVGYAYVQGYEPVIAVVEKYCADIAAKVKAEALAQKGAAPEGVQTVTALILHVKPIPDGFGGSQLKALLQLENKATVYGTIPHSIAVYNPAAGDRIELTASFTPAEKDATHAFYKRPRKATLLVDDNQQ